MRFQKRKIVLAIGCISALTGCASYFSGKEFSAYEVRPVTNIQQAESSAENFYHIGEYYQRKKQWLNALESYQKALSLQTEYVEAHNGLGIVYATLGQYELAIDHFKKAIALDASKSYLHNNLGYAYYLQGVYHEAELSFQAAISNDPRNGKAKKNLTLAHKKMGVSEKLARTLKATSNSETMSTKYPAQLTHENHLSQQLVQVAPNVYEFRSQRETQNKVENKLVSIVMHDEQETQLQKNIKSLAQGIEVSNGNGVTGMARNVATQLNNAGLGQARLTNHQTFKQVQTEIYHRVSAHALAEKITQLLPGQIKLIESDDLREDINLKILLGQDIANFKALSHNSHQVTKVM